MKEPKTSGCPSARGDGVGASPGGVQKSLEGGAVAMLEQADDVACDRVLVQIGRQPADAQPRAETGIAPLGRDEAGAGPAGGGPARRFGEEARIRGRRVV